MRMEGKVDLALLSRGFRHGFRTLSLVNWPLVSGLSVSVAAALVSIVGAILVVKDGKMGIPTSLPWSFRSENQLETTSLFVPGLQNLGNNCFLNVVLQALASCSCFQTFLHSVVRECEVEDLTESVPLTVALATLLEELSLISSENVVLSPRKVMLALSQYIPDFNLTSQQDAAEAFLHLLCSLREEFGDCYAPKMSSLADILASNQRILNPIQSVCQTEWERWQQLFLGPFDGILGSILTCQSCSSQISLTFESFDCLPLSPVLSSGATIKFGCTLLDCLKQFIVAEHVENYHCSNCWHNAAIKYLSLMGGNEKEIEKLRTCSNEEFCDCKKLCDLEKLPWSNKFSRALKQLSIARCPGILCIQLKRVSVSGFGEPIKLEGHISFPLILDVFPFMTTKLGLEIQEADVHSLPMKLQTSNRSNPLPNHYLHQSERRTLNLNDIYGTEREHEMLDDVIDHGMVSSENLSAHCDDTMFLCNGSSSETLHRNTHAQFSNKVQAGVSRDILSRETCLYRLVSVVEHFGGDGSGHYTIYRRMTMESSDKSESNDQFNPTPLVQWFCVSDSQVCSVSEGSVLSAEASLLFYERIPKT